MTPTRFLSSDDVEHFLSRGHLVVKECFSREFAEDWTRRAFIRLGYDPADPSTWQKGRVHMPVHERREVREMAPRAWSAICDLLGGEDRIKQPCSWGDGFIVNLQEGWDRPWEAPSAASPGWHKDGDWFRHFLDSPEQGLLTIVVWSDIQSRGGATFIATDSVARVAHFLVQHPEGVLPPQFNFKTLISECETFGEATGSVGDVVLIHPYMLHASSQNTLRVPRFITNPAVSLREPMQFDRADGQYSPVELAILRGLHVDRLEFAPTAPRERVFPERERIQQRMLQEEQARLAALVTS